MTRKKNIYLWIFLGGELLLLTFTLAGDEDLGGETALTGEDVLEPFFVVPLVFLTGEVDLPK